MRNIWLAKAEWTSYVCPATVLEVCEDHLKLLFKVRWGGDFKTDPSYFCNLEFPIHAAQVLIGILFCELRLFGVPV
jgi:hypothetical protein